MFKIGTLDTLMELNETLAKIDLTLDSTVKKIEKQAKEIVNQELKIELTQANNQKPISKDVAEYIKEFRWEDTKYPRARSLIEITGMITEVINKLTNDLLENENNR